MPESLLRVEPGTCISVPYEDKPDGIACVLAVLQKVSISSGPSAQRFDT